jgi:hypothetical protein
MAQTLVPTEECNLGVRKMSVIEIGFAKLNKVTVLGDFRVSVDIHIWSGTYTYKLYDMQSRVYPRRSFTTAVALL